MNFMNKLYICEADCILNIHDDLKALLLFATLLLIHKS